MPFEMNSRGLVALALQFLLPLLVGLLTKQSWPSGTKAILLLLLTAVTQFLVQLQDFLAGPDGSRFDWQSIAYAVLIGFVVSVATHFGLWKPTGAAATAQMTLVNDGHSDDFPRSTRVRR
jgi:hypothetical protein